MDESVGGTETATNDVVRPQLRELASDFVRRNQFHVFQTHRHLFFEVRPQVGQVLIGGGAEKISLWTVIARIAQMVFEGRIERNRVERHLNVDGGRKLGAHAAHSLPSRSLALCSLALDYEDVPTSRSYQVIGKTRPDNSSADDEYAAGEHAEANCNWCRT